MKKRTVVILLAAIIVVSAVAVIANRTDVTAYDSPNGEYRIVGWLIDKGGFGYSGAYYIKEKGIFSKMHKLGTGPFSCEWLSDTEFFVRHSNAIDGDIENTSEDNYYREYSVSDFFG